MKSIGIKLADGTFYPLLEEGNPEKRTLDLTTVMDNQTKVQVEVYRTETGTSLRSLSKLEKYPFAIFLHLTQFPQPSYQIHVKSVTIVL